MICKIIRKFDGKVPNLTYDFADYSQYGIYYYNGINGSVSKTLYNLQSKHTYEYGYSAVWAETKNAISIVYESTGLKDPLGGYIDPEWFKRFTTK